jgi:hypothetical protein
LARITKLVIETQPAAVSCGHETEVEVAVLTISWKIQDVGMKCMALYGCKNML